MNLKAYHAIFFMERPPSVISPPRNAIFFVWGFLPNINEESTTKTQQQINIHNSCILNQVWLQQSRIGLSLYDISGLGYLREADLENYILEMIPTLPQVCNLVLTVFFCFFL